MQDRNLVTQHKDLNLFEPLAAQTEHDPLHDLAQPHDRIMGASMATDAPSTSHKTTRQRLGGDLPGPGPGGGDA
jgi:hypothetical protein